MRVDRMLDPHCDFELLPHPWPWPLIFKVKFLKCCISGMGCQIDMERKGCESIGYRNWYRDWGHCGVTNDLGSSPQPEGEGCGELPRSLVTPQWPKSRYQFLFYHDASKHIKSMLIRVCISRKSLIKLLPNNHLWKHGPRPLSQQLP